MSGEGRRKDAPRKNMRLALRHSKTPQHTSALSNAWYRFALILVQTFAKANTNHMYEP
jgi:hypothetical protein